MTLTHPDNGSAFRAPSAWIPLALAAGAIALLAGYLATGHARGPLDTISQSDSQQ